MCDKERNDMINRHPSVRACENVKARKHGAVKVVMIILFVLTLCCPLFALLSLFLVNGTIPRNGLFFMKTLYVFWCWLPIPIASVILGFRYKKAGMKCKKNVIGGFITGAVLLIYGCFCLFPTLTFEQDYAKIDSYRMITDASLPDSGQLEIVEWGTYFDDDKTEYVVINAYYEGVDVEDLERSIEDSDNWIPCETIRSDLRALLPSTLKSDSDAYYSIYNKTTGEYNALPAAGSYEIYAMKYDRSDKQLAIHRFIIDYRT